MDARETALYLLEQYSTIVKKRLDSGDISARFDHKIAFQIVVNCGFDGQEAQEIIDERIENDRRRTCVPTSDAVTDFLAGYRKRRY